MQNYLLLSSLLFLSIAAFGQQSFKKNDVYVEFLGNGIYASVDYERQITSRPGLGLRAGIGYFSGDEKFRVSVLIGVNYLFDLGSGKSFVDAGIGGTWSGAAGLKLDDSNGVRDYHEHIWSIVPGLGYRHHTQGNLMWRISFTPIINKYRTEPYFGISFGKRF